MKIQIRHYQRALAVDPSYAQARAWQACVLERAMHRGFIAQTEEGLERAFAAAETVRSLDDNDAECHRILCEINLIRKDFDRTRIRPGVGAAQ
jgi:adenylate cyclase